MSKELTPIFLLSLPRSGSTLLQKILGVSPQIHTVSEPWLALPLAYMCQREGTLSTYGHSYYFEAYSDFLETLERGQRDFDAALRNFILSLYMMTGPDEKARYFLDKTPRYYMIAPFLARVFPDAKFVFLFRNPLEVLASVLTTWMQDRFFIYRHDLDLFHGPRALSQAYENMMETVVAVQYSDLVVSPEREVKRVCTYLDIPFDTDMLKNYRSIRLRGRMGDQRSVKEEDSVSLKSVGKWKSVLNTRYRKVFSRRYVRWLGNDTLRYFGTSVEALEREIASISEIRSGSFRDLFFHTTSTLKRILFLDHYKRLFRAAFEGRRISPYT